MPDFSLQWPERLVPPPKQPRVGLPDGVLDDVGATADVQPLDVDINVDDDDAADDDEEEGDHDLEGKAGRKG